MKKVYGKGVNDSESPVQLRSPNTLKVVWRCPFYTRWANMLKRCYSEAALRKRPLYRGVEVCEAWLIFSIFKAWMQTQDWEGLHLDKDILGDGQLYSPETCVFISSEMNSFIKSSKNQFNLPEGVSRNTSGGIYAHITIDRVNNYLGSFDTIEEAYSAYKMRKRERAVEIFSDCEPHVLDALLSKFS
jgi:hypothetical protein